MKKFISLLLTGLLLFAAAGCAPDQKGEITEIEVDPAYTRYDITEAIDYKTVQGDLWRPGGIPGGPWRGAPIQILCVSGRPDGLGSGIPDPGAAGLNGGLLRRRGRGPAPPYNLEGRNENG